MRELTKADCGRQLSPEENKKELLKMLDQVTSFCDSHQIRYYLSGGTLLGAIRHKGFIPWDDDVDVNMPRPDVERLYVISGGKIGNLVLLKPNTGRYSTNAQFYKLFNPRFILEDTRGDAMKSTPVYYPMNIDIFPVDGFPEDARETEWFCRRLIYLRKMVGISFYPKVIGKSFFTRLAHAAVFIPARMVGYDRWTQKFQRCARSYDFDRSDYVGVTTTVHYIRGEKVRKSDYCKRVDVDFEGRKCSAPSNYDTYLTQLYGNYMELPPVEKRVSGHVINVFRRKKNV